jgi:hypothetical protein
MLLKMMPVILESFGVAQGVQGREAISGVTPEQRKLAGEATQYAMEDVVTSLMGALERGLGETAQRAGQFGIERGTTVTKGLGRVTEEFMRQVGSAGARAQAQEAGALLELPFKTAQVGQQLDLGKMSALTNMPQLMQLLSGLRMAQTTTTQDFRGLTTEQMKQSFMAQMGNMMGSIAGLGGAAGSVLSGAGYLKHGPPKG